MVKHVEPIGRHHFQNAGVDRPQLRLALTSRLYATNFLKESYTGEVNRRHTAATKPFDLIRSQNSQEARLDITEYDTHHHTSMFLYLLIVP